jgi:hypothetical protein
MMVSASENEVLALIKSNMFKERCFGVRVCLITYRAEESRSINIKGK